MGQIVENVYAEAIFELALEVGRVEEIYEELRSIRDVFLSSKDFASLIVSPLISSSEKKSILKTVFESQVSREVYHSLLLLVERNRMSAYKGIVDEYENLYYKHANILKAKVYTTMPLDKDITGALKDALKKLTSSDIVIDAGIDETLLGGIKVVIGDKIIDDTTLFRLNKLEAGLRDVKL